MKELIFVDLDGTLVRSDLLFESFMAYIKSHPFRVFRVLKWLMRGRAYMKARLSENVSIALDTLPVNEQLLRYLSKAKDDGAEVILITASHQKWADQIQKVYPIFDAAIGSSESINLKGETKLARIHEIAQGRSFTYAGDARADFPIFKAADKSLIVNASPLVAKKAAALSRESVELDPPLPSLKQWARALRVHQWSKNTLIFAPLIAGHIFSWDALVSCFIAWIAFSLCASSVYLLNDLVDLESDRTRWKKKNRPIAAGRIAIAHSLPVIPALLIAAFVVASHLDRRMVIALLGYYTLTFLYSFWLKKIVLIDIVVLSLLYTVRILAGGYVLQIPVSNWLLAFSVFLFLSLAFIKRYSELLALRQLGVQKAHGRGFHSSDMEMVGMLGVSSGLVSVMVILLYLNSDSTASLYRAPNALWLITPAMIYWISRMWLLAARGALHEDPVVFAMRDKPTYVLLAYVTAVLFAAI